MISIGTIQHHEQGEPYVFVSQDKKRKGRAGPSNTNKIAPTFSDSNGRLRKDRDMSKIDYYDFHRFGHYAQDCQERGMLQGQGTKTIVASRITSSIIEEEDMIR